MHLRSVAREVQAEAVDNAAAAAPCTAASAVASDVLAGEARRDARMGFGSRMELCRSARACELLLLDLASVRPDEVYDHRAPHHHLHRQSRRALLVLSCTSTVARADGQI